MSLHTRMFPSRQACSTLSHKCTIWCSRKNERGDVPMPHGSEETIHATVGIDVSKDRLEVVLHTAEREQPHAYANSAAGFADLHTWLCSQGVTPQQTQVALEAT